MNNKLVELIRRYPVRPFFIIVILLSFGLLFPAVFIPRGGTLNQLMGFYLSRLPEAHSAVFRDTSSVATIDLEADSDE